jgi:hypothetical protein
MSPADAVKTAERQLHTETRHTETKRTQKQMHIETEYTQKLPGGSKRPEKNIFI